MKAISIQFYIYTIICLGSFMPLEASYKDRCVAKEDERDRNFYYLSVSDDENKEVKVPTSISKDAAKYLGWLRRHGADSLGTRANRLVVPIALSHWKRITDCFDLIVRKALVKLRFHVLDRLTITQFADLLIFASFLEFEELLEHGGREFVSQFKRENIEDFIQRGSSYLSGDQDSVVFRTNGKLPSFMSSEGIKVDIDWATFIDRLKSRLAPYILDEDAQHEIRANLKKILICQGDVSYGDSDSTGGYVSVCGYKDDGGFCEVRDSLDGKVVISFNENSPLIGTCFSASPLFLCVSQQSFDAYYILGQNPPRKKGSIALEKGDEVSLFTQNAEHTKVALAVGHQVIICDVRRVQKLWTLEPPEEAPGKIVSLAFVPHSPLLIDMREGGGINFWNADTGKLFVARTGHTADITKYATELGKIVTASKNGQVIVWTHSCEKKVDTVDCKISVVEQREFPQENPICFNEAATKIVLSSQSNGGSVVDLREGAHVPIVLLLDRYPITEGCFARDDLLATLSADNRVIMWNPLDGERLTQICIQKPVRMLKFSLDGECLMTCHPDKTVILWYYGNQKLARYFEKKLSFEQALLFYAWKGHDSTIKDRPHLLEIIKTIDFEGMIDFF